MKPETLVFKIHVSPSGDLSDVDSIESSSLFGSTPSTPTSMVTNHSNDTIESPTKSSKDMTKESKPLEQEKQKLQQPKQEKPQQSKQEKYQQSKHESGIKLPKRASSFTTPPLPRVQYDKDLISRKNSFTKSRSSLEKETFTKSGSSLEKESSIRLSRLQNEQRKSYYRNSCYQMLPADLRLPPPTNPLNRKKSTSSRQTLIKHGKEDNILKLKIACDYIQEDRVAVKLRKDKLRNISELRDVVLYKLCPLVPWPKDQIKVSIIFPHSSLNPVALPFNNEIHDSSIDDLIMAYIDFKSKVFVKATLEKNGGI